MGRGKEPNASESSPLLGNSTAENVAIYVESGHSTVGPLPSEGDIDGNVIDGDASNVDEETGLSRHITNDSGRDVQFTGMPEVRKRMKFFLPAVAIGIFLAAADLSLVATAAGTIGSDLKALKNTSWVATGYFLTLTSFQPLYGKLSDIFGRKSCLLVAYTIFGFGCLWCGLARTMPEFVVARAIAGIGGGGMTTVVNIMMSDIIPLRERGTWQGVINLIYATGAGIGAPLGGVLTEQIGWRWAFMGQFPLCVLAFLSVAFTLNLPKTNSSDWRSRLRRVDFFGAITLICAVTTLLVGLDQGSNKSWSTPVTITCLAISGPLFVLFVFIEEKVASEPFAPARIIFERSLFASYLCNFFSFAGWFGVLFYVPLYFQAVQKLNPTQAGVRLLPGVIFGVTGSLLGGVIMQRTGRYYWITVGGYTLLFFAGVPIVLWTGLLVHNTLGIFLGLAMGGLGNGSGVTTSLIALISNASPADQAIATACSYLFRSLGSAIGLSVQSALFQASLRNYLEARLEGDVDAGEIARKVRESLEYVRDLSPALQIKVRAAYGDATTAVFWLVIAMTSGSMIASWFIKEKRLSK